jgi:hypothetical protein
MGVLGVKLILETPWIGFASALLLKVLIRVSRCPAAPITLAAAAVIGWATGGAVTAHETAVTANTSTGEPLPPAGVNDGLRTMRALPGGSSCLNQNGLKS